MIPGGIMARPRQLDRQGSVLGRRTRKPVQEQGKEEFAPFSEPKSSIENAGELL